MKESASFPCFCLFISFNFFCEDYCPQSTYQRGGLAHRSSQSDIEQGLCSEGPWGLFGCFKVWRYNLAEDWVDNLLLSYSSVSGRNHRSRRHSIQFDSTAWNSRGCKLPVYPDHRPSTCTDPYFSVCTSDRGSEYRWTRSMNGKQWHLGWSLNYRRAEKDASKPYWL